jgi:hypothetical protein
MLMSPVGLGSEKSCVGDAQQKLKSTDPHQQTQNCQQQKVIKESGKNWSRVPGGCLIPRRKSLSMLLVCIFRNKGVKVELGIPYELWDKPSAEITNMKTQVMSYQCELQYIYFFVRLAL